MDFLVELYTPLGGHSAQLLEIIPVKLDLDSISQQLPPNPLICLLQHTILFALIGQ